MESNLFTKRTVKTFKTRNYKPFFKSIFFLAGCVFGMGNLCAQGFFLPVDGISLMRMERAGVPIQKKVHFGYKPVLHATANVEFVKGLGKDTTKYYFVATQKLYSNHLIEVDKPGLKLHIDPLFHFSYGRETKAYEEKTKSSLYTNTRGFSLSAQIGENVFFHTDFRENQGRFPQYLSHFIDSLESFPGNGRVKSFKEDGYDFGMANGYVGVNATPWLSLNLGHGKQFVGHGYRSVLLSDNAFNYPYAGYVLNFGKGKFQYRYTIQLMQNLERLPKGDAPESVFKRKYANQNYLSYKPLRNLEIGIFESIVWKYYNDTIGTLPFNARSLNPVPLFNSAVEGLNNPDANALVGLNLAWQPYRFWRLYGQAMLDDNKTERRYGYQIGSKFSPILKRLDLLAEYNVVTKGSYSAAEVLQGYTNHNQPLAHPFGAGFKEIVGQIRYYHNRIYAMGRFVHADFDSEGRSPLISSENNMEYTVKELNYGEIKVAYIFNPKTNFQIYARFVNRVEKTETEVKNNQFWYIGIQTSLQNIYTDF